MAHRYSWQIHNGDIPKGMFICHTCDVPSCVNPAHLFIGTPQDNVNDKVYKGRQRTPHGIENGSAKLTDDSVRIIRGSNKTLDELATEFGVNRSTIGFARTGKTWKHVRGYVTDGQTALIDRHQILGEWPK